MRKSKLALCLLGLSLSLMSVNVSACSSLSTIDKDPVACGACGGKGK